MVTEEEFKIAYKGYSYSWDSYKGINFRLDLTGKEVVEYLEKNGYNVFLHKAIGKVKYTSSDGFSGEVNTTGYGHDYVERMIALKPGETPPEKWEDTEYGYSYPDAISIFSNLMKQKLLNL